MQTHTYACTQLYKHTHTQVTVWLASAPAAVESSIRPGCVFLTLHLLLDKYTHSVAVVRGESI